MLERAMRVIRRRVAAQGSLDFNEANFEVYALVEGAGSFGGGSKQLTSEALEILSRTGVLVVKDGFWAIG